MRLTHLGHSCLLVETGDSRVLIDPGTWSPSFEDLRDLHAIVVTHQHADHADPERLPTLVAANPDALLLVESQAAALLRLDAQPFTAATDIALDGVRLRGLGEQHAVITELVPRIANTGLLLTCEGEPSLYHPGDALDVDPRQHLDGELDILATPLAAPWCASKETIAYVRRLAPRTIVPIHDAIVSPAGRRIYLGHMETFSHEQTRVLDLAGAGSQRV